LSNPETLKPLGPSTSGLWSMVDLLPSFDDKIRTICLDGRLQSDSPDMIFIDINPQISPPLATIQYILYLP
jgi:hypothetical protein